MTASEASPLLPSSNAIAHNGNEPNEANADATNSDKDLALRVARRFLYMSHVSSQFTEQTWQFSLLLFLAAFTNYSSVFLVSSYGLISGLTVCLAGPAAGRFFVDSLRWNRLWAARFLIGTQNVCVMLATCCCYYVLVSDDVVSYPSSEANEGRVLDWFQQKLPGVVLTRSTILLISGIHVFGSIAQVLDSAFLVAIERDWIVVMDQASTSASHKQRNDFGNQHRSWLSETNVVMKQIDLSCRIVAPAMAGFLLGSATPSGHEISTNSSTHGHASGTARDLADAALLVGMMNFVSLAIEYLCTARIYSLVPELAENVRTPDHHAGPRQAYVNDKSASDQSLATSRVRRGLAALIPIGLATYWDQPVVWAGIALSMLFFNALTFGGLMTAYLVWRGMSLESIGWWRGVSAAIGLLGTYAFRYSSQRFTLVTTGLWSVLYQLVFISFSFASLFWTDSRYYNMSMVLFVGGVCLSRIGLWVFDITVTQLMQEFVPTGVRGVVGGTQQSLNAFFQLSSFALGLFLPNPHDFPIYTAAGYAAVGGAALAFFLGVFLRRQELMTPTEKSRQSIR